MRTHAQDARAAAAAAARAYEDADGWSGADFGGALAVAARGQATLTVLDASGKSSRSPPTRPPTSSGGSTASRSSTCLAASR